MHCSVHETKRKRSIFSFKFAKISRPSFNFGILGGCSSSRIESEGMSFPKPDPNKGSENSLVPPGFRFHPTDEELMSYYLTQKTMTSNVVFQAIGEVDMNKCEPWDLQAKSKLIDQNEFYFFNLRDRKYPTGMRANRATEAGYWKATGKDREVMSKSTRGLLGMKKTLVFYTGRAPNGHRTNWIMHEYRLEGESKPRQQEWVVCRVFERSVLLKRPPAESFLPDPQSLESPMLHSVKANFAYSDHGSLAEQLDYLQGAMFPAHETSRRPSSSSMKVKNESTVGDNLEYLVSCWDRHSPEPIWDVSVIPH